MTSSINFLVLKIIFLLFFFIFELHLEVKTCDPNVELNMLFYGSWYQRYICIYIYICVCVYVDVPINIYKSHTYRIGQKYSNMMFFLQFYQNQINTVTYPEGFSYQIPVQTTKFWYTNKENIHFFELIFSFLSNISSI